MSTTHLDICISDVASFFSPNWLAKYDFDKEEAKIPDIQKSKNLFASEYSDFENKFFDDLNFSILKGEYVDSDVLKKLSDLSNKIQGELLNIEPPSKVVQDAIFDITKTTESILILALSYYIEFTTDVTQKFKLTVKEYIFKYQDSNPQIYNEKDWSGKSTNLFFFQLNIIVAEFDHNLSINENQISNLFDISLLLSKAPAEKKYARLIKKKCEYLRNKLLLRIKHEKKNKQIFTLVNGKEKQISVNGSKDGTFDEWIDYIDSHYDLNEDSTYLIGVDFELIKYEELSTLSLHKLHRLIKYYKDVDSRKSTNIKFLKDIRNEIASRWEKSKKERKTNTFNFHALATALNYAINNEFSLTCEDSSKSIEEVLILYKEVIEIQTRTGIKNFFPQTKFLKFLLKKLRTIHDSNKALDSIAQSRIIIDHCTKINESYEVNVLWSEKNYNYVFQLPFEECFINANDPNLDRIFISSTFLLPLPKDKYIAEFQEYKAEILQIESTAKVFENINSDISNIRDRELKMMEMLGIFTALISFVAASLPTFRLFDTALEAALFMLALSTSFASFVLLLLVSARGLDKLKEHKKIIIWCIVITLVIWSGLIFTSSIGITKSFIEEKKDKPENPTTPTLTNTNNITINKDSSTITKTPALTLDSVNTDTIVIPQKGKDTITTH